MKKFLSFISGLFSAVYLLAIFLYTFGFYLVYKGIKENVFSKVFFGLIMLGVNIVFIWLTAKDIYNLTSKW